MSRPDLNAALTREERSRQIRQINKMRWSGLAVTWAAVGLMVARHSGVLDLPRWVDSLAVAVGATLVIGAIALRFRYQRQARG